MQILKKEIISQRIGGLKLQISFKTEGATHQLECWREEDGSLMGYAPGFWCDYACSFDDRLVLAGYLQDHMCTFDAKELARYVWENASKLPRAVVM